MRVSGGLYHSDSEYDKQKTNEEKSGKEVNKNKAGANEEE
jgi:hypothetical protein